MYFNVFFKLIKVHLVVSELCVHLEVLKFVLKSSNPFCWCVREIFINSTKHRYNFEIILTVARIR